MAPMNNEGMSLQDKIDNAIPFIFNFTTGIENSDKDLEIKEKFIRHYLMREIGFETVGLWKVFLQDRFIMKAPYYNELYKTIGLEFNYYGTQTLRRFTAGTKLLLKK